MSPGYHPAVDEIPDIDEDSIKTYQELIGVLRWSIKIERVHILLEIALLSTNLVMPRKGNLEKVYHIFGYLKQISMRRLFLIPSIRISVKKGSLDSIGNISTRI